MVAQTHTSPVLLWSNDCIDVQHLVTNDFQIAFYTHRAPDKDSVNEDALAVFHCADKGVILAIADGLGGQRDGALASQAMIESLARNLKSAQQSNTDCRTAILDAIEQANSRILNMGSGAATTLAVVEAGKSTIRSYHIGDSEILLTGQRGKLKFKTISHSPVGYAVEAGLLENEEALLHEDRHLVSNCVGVEDMHIDMGPVLTLAQYDTVLLASDGVFDNVTQDELVEMIRKGPLQKVAETLLTHCQAIMRGQSNSHPGKPDDLSFILLRRN